MDSNVIEFTTVFHWWIYADGSYQGATQRGGKAVLVDSAHASRASSDAAQVTPSFIAAPCLLMATGVWGWVNRCLCSSDLQLATCLLPIGESRADGDQQTTDGRSPSCSWSVVRKQFFRIIPSNMLSGSET